MCTYFNIKTDVAKNLIDDFFSNFGCQRNFPQEEFYKRKNFGGAGLNSEKTEVLYAELYKKAEAATGKYPVTGDFLQYIYSVLMTKDHRNIR